MDRFALHLTGGGNQALPWPGSALRAPPNHGNEVVSASRCLRKQACSATSDARGLLPPPVRIKKEEILKMYNNYGNKTPITKASLKKILSFFLNSVFSHHQLFFQ